MEKADNELAAFVDSSAAQFLDSNIEDHSQRFQLFSPIDGLEECEEISGELISSRGCEEFQQC